jgi:hypothetical protein
MHLQGGNTSLMMAAFVPSTAILGLLLSKGANPWVQNQVRTPPQALAAAVPSCKRRSHATARTAITTRLAFATTSDTAGFFHLPVRGLGELPVPASCQHTSSVYIVRHDSVRSI